MAGSSPLLVGVLLILGGLLVLPSGNPIITLFLVVCGVLLVGGGLFRPKAKERKGGHRGRA